MQVFLAEESKQAQACATILLLKITTLTPFEIVRVPYRTSSRFGVTRPGQSGSLPCLLVSCLSSPHKRWFRYIITLVSIPKSPNCKVRVVVIEEVSGHQQLSPSPPPPSLYPPHPFIPSSALPTASSLEPGTALQPQEGSGLRPDVALLFGAPALLGLVLALTLVGLVSLVSWRWRQQLRMTSPDTSEGVQQGENCLCLGRREAQRRLGVGVGVQSFGD